MVASASGLRPPLTTGAVRRENKQWVTPLCNQKHYMGPSHPGSDTRTLSLSDHSLAAGCLSEALALDLVDRSDGE